MNNKDITFILSNDYENIGNVFSKREYIYDFSFKVYINTTDSIRNIEIFKNGEPYENVIVNNTDANTYFVRDLEIINKGNYHYGVKVTINDGSVFKNGFYLKIQNNYIKNDIKIVHFSTQGLHENFNYLNVLLKVETEYNIHSVKLYRKFVNKDWEYLGEMSQSIYGYIYKDMPFDISLNKESNVLYKVSILTSNGLKKEETIEVPIYTNSFSINSIAYIGDTRTKNYNIRGGIVGHIIANLTQYHNDVFELIFDTSNNKYLSIELKEKNYKFYAEKYKLVLPNNFVSAQTNAYPNKFEISGVGIITKLVDAITGETKQDVANFNLSLVCGNDIYITFNIVPENDSDLALSTEKTYNNVVRFKNMFMDATEDFEDKTISNVRYPGFLIYKNDLRYFKQTNSNVIVPIDLSMIDSLFKSCDFVTYNQYNFYFITYTSQGINVIVFDGINYDTFTFKLDIYEPTLTNIKNNVFFRFDSLSQLEFNFINYDLTKNLEIITVKDNNLTIESCNSHVSEIFNYLRTKLLNKLNETYELEDGTVISFNRNYLIQEQLFESMNFDNFVQGFFMYQFKVAISTTTVINDEETDCILSINCTVNMTKDAYSIEKIDMNYKIGDKQTENEAYNQKPMNIMEQLNENYFIKLSNSLKTSNKNDYGKYTSCELYKQTGLIYRFTPNDFLLENSFGYNDVARMRVVELSSDVHFVFVMKDNQIICNEIRTSTAQRLHQYIFDSKIICQYLYQLNDEQLEKFSNILSIAKQNEFVDRTMYFYSLSDYENLFVHESSTNSFPMEKVIPINANFDKDINSFTCSYNTQYPLNIKNRNSFLQEMEVSLQ